MKSSLLIACLLYCIVPVIAQENHTDNPLYTEQYQIKNGLTVYLNEDHNQPNVFGAVVVKGGSKRDPEEATGIAHYFEHIMFKGTDKLGTVNYEEEKVYLDSIRIMYDLLGQAEKKEKRDSIQLKINDLSIKAAEYAIPNEFDRVVSGIGGTGINAWTSEEAICYHNMFPGNQIEKWMEIYSHRFINPVFRLFQSELETVYEEKNMSMDDFFNCLFEEFCSKLYKKHPYGQHTVLGAVEHLKNPSLTKMIEYFDTYYVANNMALILVGDFDPEQVKPLIEEKFGTWRTGEIPPMPVYPEEPFHGREYTGKRMTPVKVGLLGYHTVPEGHVDEVALEICNNILSNDASTGFVDKLYMDNKLMMAGVMPIQHTDMGAMMYFFVPKLVGQSLKRVEKMLHAEIDKVKQGNFEDEIVDAIKINLIKDHYRSLENMNSRGYFIIDAFLQNKNWEEVLKYPDEVGSVTREDIVRVSNKYYGDDYLAFYSRMGFPKKKKLKKPPYKPVEPGGTEKKSEFAKHIEEMPETPAEPRFIEFGKDVIFSDIQEEVHYYYTPDPVNRLFSLTLSFGVGTYVYPVLDEASSYFSLIGTDELDFEKFSKELQKLGSGFYAYASDDYFTLCIDGLDEQFDATLKLINQLMTRMKPDEKQLKKLIREARLNHRFEAREPYSIGDALRQYAIYRDKSDYLNRLSFSEIKELTGDSLISAVRTAFRYEADIHYSGSLSKEEAAETIRKNIEFPANPVLSQSPVTIPRMEYDENTVFFLNNKKMIQSYVNFYIQGTDISEDDRPPANAFNKYFGHDMFSLVFQEIREFRSLAYSAYATYRAPFRNGEKGYTLGVLSTQADKTNEALVIFDSLLMKMPEKQERMDLIRRSLIQSVNASRPSFRWLSNSVAYWRKQGYTEDPRKEYLKRYETLEFSDIYGFYKNQIAGRTQVITIAGEKKRIDADALGNYGKLIEVRNKDIFRK
ncbi:MAG: insulinase family protein [Bacteroidetes bacterium]|nr:insulinase family protein [Bacteroidota bacterium]